MKSIHNNESVPSRSQTGRALPAALVSPPRTIAGLRDAAAACKACDLWKKATQTVFGEGPTGARIMLVGEQPGDQEDRSGHPFVGPAGRLLDEALAKAGIDHEAVYVTNVVKHFRWTASGARKTAHSQKAWLFGNSGLPSLARRRDQGSEAANSCLPGRDCCTGTPGKKLQCQPPTGSTGRLLARPSRSGNGTSILDSASARREISTNPNAGVHKRSEESGAVGRG
jgi:hypothetical protein